MMILFLQIMNAHSIQKNKSPWVMLFMIIKSKVPLLILVSDAQQPPSTYIQPAQQNTIQNSLLVLVVLQLLPHHFADRIKRCQNYILRYLLPPLILRWWPDPKASWNSQSAARPSFFACRRQSCAAQLGSDKGIPFRCSRFDLLIISEWRHQLSKRFQIDVVSTIYVPVSSEINATPLPVKAKVETIFFRIHLESSTRPHKDFEEPHAPMYSFLTGKILTNKEIKRMFSWCR